MAATRRTAATGSPARKGAPRRAPGRPPEALATTPFGPLAEAPTEVSPAGERPAPTLRILAARVLRGPNYWSPKPVVTMLVDLGPLERWPSNAISGFSDALVELLPSLHDHACSLGRRGGFISRLHQGTWMGHVTEHVALELQNLAGTEARHGKTRAAGGEGRYHVIYEYREEQVGIEAGRMAVRLVNHLVAPDDPAHAFDLQIELERLIRMAERLA
ncbi:MAG: cyanophycin synthetase family protein, partial [Candidatus Limnocylindria bacterium]